MRQVEQPAAHSVAMGDPVFTAAELPSVRAFFSFFHAVLPLTTPSTVHAGVNQLSLASLGLPMSEREHLQDLGRKAIAWSITAIGALVEAPGSTDKYLENALSYLRQIIDTPTEESLRALIAVTECMIFLFKLDLAVRYARFARIHFEELGGGVPLELQACFAFLHCHLFAITNCSVALADRWELPANLSELNQTVRTPYMLGQAMLTFADYSRGVDWNAATLLETLAPFRESLLRSGQTTLGFFFSSFMVAYLKGRLGFTREAVQTLREAVDVASSTSNLFNVPLLHVLGGKVAGFFAALNDRQYAQRLQYFLASSYSPRTIHLEPCVPVIIFDHLVQLTLSAPLLLPEPASDATGAGGSSGESSNEWDDGEDVLDNLSVVEPDFLGMLEPGDVQYLRELF
jgi:hypothetical protein